MQDEVCYLNLVLMYVRSSKIHVWNAELHRAKQDHAEPNQGLHHQIIMWVLHSSGILLSIDWWFLIDVSEWPISPIFKSQEIQKREESMTVVNSHSFLFWDTVHHLILYRSMTFQKLAVSFPWQQVFSKGSNRKMAIKKLKINCKTQK